MIKLKITDIHDVLFTYRKAIEEHEWDDIEDVWIEITQDARVNIRVVVKLKEPCQKEPKKIR